jgi:surface-anchored protein
VSFDDDGVINSCMIDFNDGTVTDWLTGLTATHNYSIPGKYNVRAKVIDVYGVESDWSEALEIDVQNTPATVDFNVQPGLEGDVNTDFTFVPVVEDIDGNLSKAKYYWDFDDKASSAEESPTHRFADDKEYNVRLAVTDEHGASTVVTKTITVKNLPPNAVGTISSTEVYVGDSVTFDAGGSSDDDDDQSDLSYSWKSSPSGLSSSKRKVTKSFSSPGTYTITLTVKDDDGDESTKTFTLTVNPKKETNGDDDEPDNTMLYAGIGAIVIIVVLVVVFLMMKSAAAKKAAAAAPAKRPKKKKKTVVEEEEDEDVEEAAVVEEDEEEEEEGGEEE